MSQMTSARRRVNTRALTVTAMFSAVAFVLMFLEFSIPVVIPSFVKMDVSELPALLAAFGLGPVYGVVVCLVKNLLHLLVTTTGGAGELGNFLLGACFILPAGLIYHMHKSRKKRHHWRAGGHRDHGSYVHPAELLYYLSGLLQLYAH